MTKRTAKNNLIRKFAHTERMIQIAEEGFATGRNNYSEFNWRLKRIIEAGKFIKKYK